MISLLDKEYVEPNSFRHIDTSQKHLNILNSETARNLWIVSSLLPSLLSYCISWYLETSPFFSFILFPFVRFSIEIILSDFLGFSMQAALTAIYKFTTPRSTQSSPEPEKGCAGLLRELVRNQEKTMFYTVTVNPIPAKEQETKTAPNLKVCYSSKYIYYTIIYLYVNLFFLIFSGFLKPT